MRHHRHAHHARHGRGPPHVWWLAKGIHRRVVTFMAFGVLAGGAGGLAIAHAAAAGAGHGGLLCIGAAVLLVCWPLTWMATWQIARPLRHLADVAAEIHGGRLESRAKIDDAPGEVGEVGEALRAVADRVAKQLRDQRALMAAVSHELRSPLARARVLVEMAREGRAPPAFADELDAEIAHMDGLVGDLLAAARIDFEAVTPIDLSAIDVARRALDLARVADGALRTEGAPGRVHADATLLGRAIALLLDNATRHGGAAVSLTVADRGQHVRFVVDDDGPGFAPGDEERAFQPFWRGAADGAKPAGEGLGLALVRQIAEAHGGRAAAENRAEGGGRVWIELPR